MPTAQKIEVSGEIGRRMRLTIERNLLALDAEVFLAPFRKRDQTEGFIGLGKQIDAVVHLAHYSRDARVASLKRDMVSKTLALQAEDGYLGVLAPEARMWRLWDVHEMSFIVHGLVSDYELFGERASLDGARRLMDYMVARWKAEPDHPFEPLRNVTMASCGFEEAILALYRATGDARYREFCVEHRKLPQWDLDIVIGRHGIIEGHAYAYLARCVAQLDLYRMHPDPILLAQSQRALDFLTRGDGMIVSGAFGISECWRDDQEGAGELGETCATAYFLYLLDGLMRIAPKPFYGDLMERALFNTLYAAQSPDGRRLRYYTPIEGPREYFDRDTYCCPCNFRRIIGELPGMVYYPSDGGIVVSLYIESSVTLDAGGAQVRIRQETDYPNSGEIRLRLDPSRPVAFPLLLRIPGWAGRMEAAVNEVPVPAQPEDDGFLRIEREWRAGDAMTLQMPMGWRWIRGRKKQAGRAALLRGPLLFCLSRARNPSVAEADLRGITLAPDSTREPIRDIAARPDGLACRIKAWSPQRPLSAAPDLELLLTEFPDPNGEAAYFRLSDDARCRSDELVR